MIKDPYIGMPIVLGRPSEPGTNKPTVEESDGNHPHMPTLPPEHPSVAPDTPLPESHPNCACDTDSKPEDNTGHTDNSSDISENCAGTFDSMVLGSLPIAMAYTPMQQWKTVYSPDEALSVGTVFPQLNLPFTGYQRR